jgi:hypothetical protein
MPNLRANLAPRNTLRLLLAAPAFASLMIAMTAMIAGPAFAQGGSSELKQQEQQQAIEGSNPLAARRTQVAFSGSGSANFTPRNFNGSRPGPTPDPSCTPTVTQVGFHVQCLSDTDSKTASTCRGSISFFAFNETRNVVGEITSLTGDAYLLKLQSGDDDIQGCELSNVAPVSSSLGNVITMSGCGLNIAGCPGDAVGSGANSALTSSGSVTLTPSD